MSNIRVFQVSCTGPLWGYKEVIDLDDYDKSEQIITEVKRRMTAYMQAKNLEVIVDEIKKLNLHTMNLERILLETTYENTIWLCDHCHSEHSCSQSSEIDENNDNIVNNSNTVNLQ